MIFNLYSRVVVKVGDDEKHVYDRSRLMYTEVAEIEKITGMSYGEWEQALAKYSIGAIAALLHILRKRDGQPSEFLTMQFNAAELDVVPIHDDGTEFTPAEVAADLAKRMKEATDGNGTGPTRAAAGAVAPENSQVTSGPGTSPSSVNGSGSVPGNGNGSPTPTSGRAKPTSTRS